MTTAGPCTFPSGRYDSFPMRLTDNQWRQIREWLKGRGVTTICPACTRDGFDIGDDLVTVPFYPVGAKDAPKQSADPMVLVRCRHCNLVRFFAVEPMDLLP